MLNFLFLEQNLSNTTVSSAAQTTGRGIEQKVQKSPVENGGAALGLIPGSTGPWVKPGNFHESDVGFLQGRWLEM